jgi:hypothetical protein
MAKVVPDSEAIPKVESFSQRESRNNEGGIECFSKMVPALLSAPIMHARLSEANLGLHPQPVPSATTWRQVRSLLKAWKVISLLIQIRGCGKDCRNSWSRQTISHFMSLPGICSAIHAPAFALLNFSLHLAYHCRLLDSNIKCNISTGIKKFPCTSLYFA